MSAEHHEVFVRESEEQITELNNALLRLESDPDDREAMDAIFRTAHTLKGNAGAMGFSGISGLAHAIEDLLDEIRNGRIAVDPDVMDLVFAGVDEIEASLEQLDAEGSIAIEHDETIEEIRAVIAQRSGDGGGDAGGDAADGGGASPDGTAEAAEAAEIRRRVDAVLDGDPDDGDDLLHAEVAIDGGGMQSVDAMLALESIAGEWDLLGTDPPREAIEDGEFDETFDVVVAGSDPDALAALLAETGQVGDHEVTAVPTDDAGETAGRGSSGGDDGAVAGGSASDDAGDGSGAGGNRSRSASMDEIKSVRVDVGQLDDLHGLVEQLVTSRIKLRRAVEEENRSDAIDNLDELDKITTHLQDTVMDMRLIPLKKVVSKFPRLVRDLAREEDKEIEFVIEGEDIELDRTILTQISDPLMHVLRNAVDHGIEPPAEREAAGKPREGRIVLRATRERDHVIIEVEDDGQGLDEDAIREKAREKSVVSERELESMSASEVYDLVFHPGFSTSEEVTDVSGRGVGMDVVHSTVKQLDGSVNVESDPGQGTTVRLRLPVTVAIVTVLFVRVGDHRYGIPIKAIDEISRANDLRTINGREVVEHDDDIYPVIKLDEALDIGGVASADGGTASRATGATDARGVGADDESGMLLRIRKSERQVALYCDEVEDQEEVVVKPLEGVLSGIPGLSGTAVLGDGNIVPILDVVTL
jgi:two-component system chemotaxis sensor kinase CheA